MRCSTGGDAAVHDHARPDRRGRLVGGEVGGHRGYLLGGDEAAVRLAGLHLGPRFLGVVVACGDAVDPGRVHRAGRDAVDPYALGDVVYGRRSREGEDPALGRAVGGPVRYAHEGRDRGDVHDRASPRAPHGGDGVLDPEEGSLEVHVHLPVPVLFGGLWRGRRHAYPGVVDHDVQAAPLRDHAPYERLDLLGPGDVRPPDQGLALYLASHPPCGLLVQVGEGDAGALLGEPDRDGAPDTGPCARHYGPLAFETLHRTPCPHPENDQYNDARIGGANVGRGATMDPFPDWMNDLPEPDTTFAGLEGRLLSSPHGQAVFFRATEEFEVPPHAHGAQWGIVVTGRLHLTVDGEAGTYEPGDTYDIPAGAEHSARLEAGTCIIDVFQEPDRYNP